MITFSIRWLTSKKVRTAVQMRHHVWKYVNAQRDLLKPEAIDALEASMQQVTDAIHQKDGAPTLDEAMENIEKTANDWLKPYPHAALRENIEVFLVAAAVVLAFRSFFFQPMAIPSGSAQPTFWGIVAEDLKSKQDATVPTGLKKIYLSWVKGEKYYHVQARNSGVFRAIDEKPVRVIPFITKQRFMVGNEKYTLWWPPENLWSESKLQNGLSIKEGDDIIKLKVTSGDHLFVDRFTYNFRRPTRGETIVFKSTGVPKLTQNTHYIKRLVGLGGEKISIGDDRHAYINGTRLEASDPGFEFVYSFGDNPPEDSKYSGHVNGKVALEAGNMAVGMNTQFRDGETEYQIRDNHYFVMGDNTMNSYDSRAWLDFPREKVIGKQFFVFWPITDRFGWHNK
jgi:signal peptidase I